MRTKKCPDCFRNFYFVPRQMFCATCFKKRYGYFPNAANPKTSKRGRVDSGSRGEVDTRSEHSQGPIWVHRPSSPERRPDPRSAGDELQQHFGTSKEDRKRRIVVGSTESLLASLGYRLAQTK